MIPELIFSKLEVGNDLPFYRQKYREMICFWNPCEYSFPMRPKVTFSRLDVPNFPTYFRQKY